MTILISFMYSFFLAMEFYVLQTFCSLRIFSFCWFFLPPLVSSIVGLFCWRVVISSRHLVTVVLSSFLMCSMEDHRVSLIMEFLLFGHVWTDVLTGQDRTDVGLGQMSCWDKFHVGTNVVLGQMSYWDKCRVGTNVVRTNVVLGHMSCWDKCRVRTVSYTHLTLPTNREV